MMKRRNNNSNIPGKIVLFFFMVLGISLSTMAQQVPGLYAYPEKNQSKDQQMRDEHSCQAWAQEQARANPTPMEEPTRHKTAKRTAIGAGAGAIIGGGTGAAIGAGAGAISGRRSKKRDQREAEAAVSDDFIRAYSSCLKSKGYAVE